MAAGEPLGLLLLLTEAGGVTPTATGKLIAIVLPDEVATGVQVRLWAQGIDNAGMVALDSAPQITIWTLSSTGVRSTDTLTTYMTASNDGYYYDWTPATDGTYEVQVAGLVSATAYFNAVPVTVRPKFDPIGLAVSDVLVARM